MKPRSMKNGGPAFPQNDDTVTRLGNGVFAVRRERGMTLRAYAAIHLRVPESGHDWLDAMIRRAQDEGTVAKPLSLDLVAEVESLCARLCDWSADHLTESGARDWFGHVAPVISRLREAAAASKRRV